MPSLRILFYNLDFVLPCNVTRLPHDTRAGREPGYVRARTVYQHRQNDVVRLVIMDFMGNLPMLLNKRFVLLGRCLGGLGLLLPSL